MGARCRSRWLRAVAALGLALAVFPGVARTPGEDGQDGTDAAIARSQRAIGNTLGAHRLRDREGREVSLERYRGKPLVVSFVYTACSQVCPTTTRFLARAVGSARSALGPASFNVVTIGFNQPYDTPPAMAAFARQMGIDDPNWEFLSPDAAALARIAEDVGFSYWPSAGGFDHLTQVTILDAKGRVVRQVYGESFELPMLVAPLKEMVTGEAAPPPASLAEVLEKVRVLCTVYDPRLGRYRLDYGVVLEILVGASIVIGVLQFLLREWLRHRRRARAA